MHGEIVSDTTNEYGVRIQKYADGYSEAYRTPEETKRGQIATLRFKIRVNELMGTDSPNMRAALAELTR